MKRLPKTLYIQWKEEANGSPWLNAAENIEDMLDSPPDEQTVGVYTLTRCCTVKSSVTVTEHAQTSFRRKSK